MTVPIPEFQAPPEPPPAVPAAPQPTGSSTPAPPMDPDGFPLETPWRAMDGADSAAAKYLLKQSRKHESEANTYKQKLAAAEPAAQQYQALADASKSDLERERDQAKAEAETLKQQAAETRKTFGAQVVEARLAGAADAKGMKPDALKTLAGDLTRFLGDDGVNTEAIDDFLAALPDKPAAEPQKPGRVDLGGGRRASAHASGTQAGAELYERLHPKKTTSA